MAVNVKKRKNDGYYLGLDIGSNSVGWAVTDFLYKIQQKYGKAMWGSILFSEANPMGKNGIPSQNRRNERTGRRRLHRRNQRIAMLDELFEPEIRKVDPKFLARMKEGMLQKPEWKVRGKDNLFADLEYDDAAYHGDYKTIYHLRYELATSAEPKDIRLVYLAIHHILKHRGHFLLPGLSAEKALDMNIQLEELCSFAETQYGLSFSEQEMDALLQIANGKEPENKTGKGKKSAEETCKNAIRQCLQNGKVDLKELYAAAPQKLFTAKKIVDFTKTDLETLKNEWEEYLGDDYELLMRLHAIYSCILLKKQLGGKKYFSEMKKGLYDEHAEDLHLLKELFKKHYAEDGGKAYRRMFHLRTKDEEQSDETTEDTKKASKKKEINNYCRYVGDGCKHCKQTDFWKFVESEIKKYDADLEQKQILAKIKAGTFMPKQVSGDNSKIPNQLHLQELDAILKNAAEYLPFLTQKDEQGLTPAEKIRQIFTFRVPYYVGPLSPSGWAEFCSEKLERQKLYPWNYAQIVDLEKSAQKFVERMVSGCTYLNRDQSVHALPRYSIAYSHFAVLNELNDVRVEGCPLPVETKQAVFNELFEKQKKVTKEQLVKWLKKHGFDVTEETVNGMSGKEFKSTLATEQAMQQALGEWYSDEAAEEFIELNTVFRPEQKDMKREVLMKSGRAAKNLPREVQEKAFGVRCKGWGKLSREFLTEIIHTDKNCAEGMNILQKLWSTTNNLSQLMTRNYTYAEQVEEWNANAEQRSDRLYALVDDLYVPASVKRSIWRTLRGVKEIVHVMGSAPEKIFVEMVRGGGKAGERTESRKAWLLSKYKQLPKQEKEQRDWEEEIKALSEEDLRDDRLFLYYMQMGRCMYTEAEIPLAQVKTGVGFDRDHIIPRSIRKDDSVHDNMVLADENINKNVKKDLYPLNQTMPEIQRDRRAFWEKLRRYGLISEEKLARLLRTELLTEEERADFIERQLVETRQSSKAVAELLKKLYPKTEIVYVKAGNVSDFRGWMKMPKSRALNDLHHAKDAYLNIVVGNVWDVNFGKDFRRFVGGNHKFKEDNLKYSMQPTALYARDIRRSGETAWIAGPDGTEQMVRRMMRKNNILLAKQPIRQNGEISNVQPVSACQVRNSITKGQLPRKQGLPIERYGGLNKATISHFLLVDADGKKGRERWIAAVPLYLRDAMKKNVELYYEYCRREYGLSNPEIVPGKPLIRIQSVLEIDGQRMFVCGKTNKSILLGNAVPLILKADSADYLIKLEKSAKGMLKKQRQSEITPEDNLKLYLELKHKFETLYYGRFNNVSNVLAKNVETFTQLETGEQAAVLLELVKILNTSSRQTGNLVQIGGVKNSGVSKLLGNITDCSSVKLICQSVTGFFETEIDLKNENKS